MSAPSNHAAGPYGWHDFDPEVVEGLVENDSRFINRRPGGWIACPLSGHYDTKLAWQDDNYRKGSLPGGSPPASFRAAPTYVLESPLDNIIAGRELVAEAAAGRWGRAEAARLGNENSKGALTWNVLRSLQEAGCLGLAMRVLADVEAAAEPELTFWEQRIELQRTEPSTTLLAVRDELENDLTQRSGPDACLHVPRMGLGGDGCHVRWRLRDARRRRARRGLARALLRSLPRPLRRRRDPKGAAARLPARVADHDRRRTPGEGRG